MEQRLQKQLINLKASKSQGPDQIHPKLIKECKDYLLKPLEKPLEIIFKKSLENSQLPNIWKQGNVVAIFNSGSKTKPEVYRPISLTSVPEKWLERLIRDILVKHGRK